MTMDVASVGVTAVITAQMRAIETRRPDRLFSDDFAHALVAAAGLGVENVTLDQVGGQRVYESVAARTHYLDVWCDRLLGDTVTQVVLLGAGLDTRALRLGWLDSGLSIFEIDRSDVTRLKSQVLSRSGDDHWHGIVADLGASTWTNQLTAAGFDASAPALFVAEGLFMYLDDTTSRQIVRGVRDLAAPGSHLLAVHFGHGALLDAETQAMSAAVGSNGYAFASAIETSPGEWLGTGWDVEDAASIAQYAPSVGRRIPYDESAIGSEVTWMFVAAAAAM
ncbi:MAG: SAM-dependent methyltransferase [Gordonia paraffinivorans]